MGGNSPDKVIVFLLSKGALPIESGIESSIYTNFLNKHNTQNKYKTVYREKNLSKAMLSGCPSIAKQFAEKMSDGEIEKALKHFLEDNQFGNTIELGKERCFTGNHVKGQLEAFSGVYTILSNKCSDCLYVSKAKNHFDSLSTINKKADECIVANKNHEEFLAQRKKRSEEVEAYFDSPLGKACETLASIKNMKNAISEEEEVGRRSGFVRKNVIYQGHKNLMVLEGQLAENKKEYLQKNGKAFATSECRNHEKRTQVD